MTTLEIKNKLIKRIRSTEDQELLHEMCRFFDLEEDISDKLQLSPEQKQAIKEGQSDVQNGNFLTGHAAEKQIDQWLKK